MGTGLKQQFLLLQAQRNGNLARLWPGERCKTPTAHMKSRKLSMPAFRRFWKSEHESPKIFICHADPHRIKRWLRPRRDHDEATACNVNA
jgi:hypothetical protein